ncbi:hypothetical protein AG1IA_02236 [Rhizoctonia solani AG-1 IA]|uniref:Fungal zn(2)-Cys(6) binuclear cluster domain-containing protein n=1 Tax=Thanatephorus cucumeris (strain AG1-IA) TaxID=983506 RepID=L8X3N6_THACA|nr:hypothetical protein AG1IA_02236 [Rhizoctonia solani AG-1 IA]
MASVTTGQPTYCRYEVPFSIELCEQVYQQQDTIGLQWLHGIPDQFILLFAWIMSLCEIPGTGKDTELVTWIEAIVPQINVTTSQSGDPLLHIRRIAVQECWRFAVLIYLYMAFCGASASDPRVARAQRGFMRLVRGVKPSRNPDAFLFIPIALVGIATIDEQDRSTIRQRILGVREHAEPETTGNQTLLMLEDIWARTRNEGRPAVWLDRGIARFRVTEPVGAAKLILGRPGRDLDFSALAPLFPPHSANSLLLVASPTRFPVFCQSCPPALLLRFDLVWLLTQLAQWPGPTLSGRRSRSYISPTVLASPLLAVPARGQVADSALKPPRVPGARVHGTLVACQINSSDKPVLSRNGLYDKLQTHCFVG